MMLPTLLDPLPLCMESTRMVELPTTQLSQSGFLLLVRLMPGLLYLQACPHAQWHASCSCGNALCPASFVWHVGSLTQCCMMDVTHTVNCRWSRNHSWHCNIRLQDHSCDWSEDGPPDVCTRVCCGVGSCHCHCGGLQVWTACVLNPGEFLTAGLQYRMLLCSRSPDSMCFRVTTTADLNALHVYQLSSYCGSAYDLAQPYQQQLHTGLVAVTVAFLDGGCVRLCRHLWAASLLLECGRTRGPRASTSSFSSRCVLAAASMGSAADTHAAHLWFTVSQIRFMVSQITHCADLWRMDCHFDCGWCLCWTHDSNSGVHTKQEHG